jgi:hypothetical protein
LPGLEVMIQEGTGGVELIRHKNWRCHRCTSFLIRPHWRKEQAR